VIITDKIAVRPIFHNLRSAISAVGAKRPFIAKGASGLATGKECAKPYQSSQEFL
jgi:hypothetical protein